MVWHRRAGKDLLLLNFTIAQAVQRVGVYWHVFPTAKQGRKILWDGVTKDGRLFLDHWPRALIASRNESEMKIKTRDGAVWQIVGSDNYTDALIGGKPAPGEDENLALHSEICARRFRALVDLLKAQYDQSRANKALIFVVIALLVITKVVTVDALVAAAKNFL